MNQMKSVAGNIATIAGMALAGGMYGAWEHGEVKTYSDILKALHDCGVPAIMAGVGWIVMKSPWAKKDQ